MGYRGFRPPEDLITPPPPPGFLYVSSPLRHAFVTVLYLTFTVL